MFVPTVISLDAKENTVINAVVSMLSEGDVWLFQNTCNCYTDL